MLRLLESLRTKAGESCRLRAKTTEPCAQPWSTCLGAKATLWLLELSSRVQLLTGLKLLLSLRARKTCLHRILKSRLTPLGHGWSGYKEWASSESKLIAYLKYVGARQGKARVSLAVAAHWDDAKYGVTDTVGNFEAATPRDMSMSKFGLVLNNIFVP